MLQAGPLLSLSPSFNSYSSSAGNLAEIAARVVSELRRENQSAAVFLYDDDDHPWLHSELDIHHDHDLYCQQRSEPSVDDDEDESEFEFAFVGRESAWSPISADEIFHNGQIRPVYPLFGKSLDNVEENKPRNDDAVADGKGNDKISPPSSPSPSPPEAVAARRRQPLRKLMVEEERELAASCSSSEADELDGLQHGTYCVWTPRNGAGERKKSKSTGTSSRRWKFRDLLLSRSNSDDGKAANNNSGTPAKLLVIARPGANNKKVSKGEKVTGTEATAAAEGRNSGCGGVAAADKLGKEAEKRKSFVPHKQDLVGFLANVNGLGRSLHPF